jgi:hypothetical protein
MFSLVHFIGAADAGAHNNASIVAEVRNLVTANSLKNQRRCWRDANDPASDSFPGANATDALEPNRMLRRWLPIRARPSHARASASAESGRADVRAPFAAYPPERLRCG